jgi:hypothetical protein
MDMDVEELIMPKGFELKGLSVVGWDGWPLGLEVIR